MTTISNLKEEVGHLNFKLQGMTKFIPMLDFGTETLELIIGVGKTSKYMKGIGSIYKSSNSKNMYFSYVKKIKFIMFDSKSQYLVKNYDHHPNVHTTFSWVCHHCSHQGHI